MNIQAMMKQAQKLQKEMMSSKEEIDKTVFTASQSFVTVEVLGNKEIKSIKIDNGRLEKADIEMLEDMLLVAINDAIKQIDKETEKKLGKYTQGMPGLF